MEAQAPAFIPTRNYHPGSGNIAEGRSLDYGEIIRPTDLYAAPSSCWLTARHEDIGQMIAAGCTTLWVRPFSERKDVPNAR